MEQSEPQANSSRINRLDEVLHTTHLNSEERDSLETICHEYSDIFFLDGDKVTATSAVTLEIGTSDTVPPMNGKPYRLPQRHRQEITEQIEILEQEDIITRTSSSCSKKTGCE